MNVGIIGLGYVGLTLAAVAALKKKTVFGLEKSNHIKNSLRKKKAHFYEPGLDSLLTREIDKNLHIVDDFGNNLEIDTFIITVGTPLVAESEVPNFEYIESAMETMKGVYTGDQLVILRSTISVGTTKKVVIPFLAEMSGKKPEDVLAAFCPERTIEGKAVRELQVLPQVIGANNLKALYLAETFFRDITPTIIKVDTLEAAELIKLVNNTYRDTHFALGNVFNEIAQSFGINGVQLIDIANKGYDRSHIPSPGFVGGPCLEKDSYILTYNMADSTGKQFVIGARKYNESLEDTIVNWIIRQRDQGRIKNKLCLSGLAFKGVPETSDLRGSNSINVARKLQKLGFELTLHDFIASPDEVKYLRLGVFSADFYEAITGHSMLITMNNNLRYARLAPDKIAERMAKPRIILDMWGLMEYLENTSEQTVFTLGNIHIEKK